MHGGFSNIQTTGQSQIHSESDWPQASDRGFLKAGADLEKYTPGRQ